MSSFIFIDPRVADAGRLVTGLEQGVEVVVLDTAQDGIMQIAEALASATDLDSIHIISHGSSGALYLGSTVLTRDNLDDYEGELALIGGTLSEEGDLLLYGCNVGAGPDGQSFVAGLADYTGADVAASDDLTGAAAAGGNWVLEAESGEIESGPLLTPAAQDNYIHTLDTIVGTSAPETLTGTSGSDLMEGLEGDDTLIGDAGNDTLDGGEGGDSMVGGAGNDRYIIDDAFSDIVVEAAGEGADGVLTDQSISSLAANIENVTYNGPDGGGVFGNGLDNVITGNAEDNTMGGNDGNDTVSYAYETNAVTIDLDPFSGFATGSGTDTLFNFENAVGGSAADDIVGNDESNVLNGGGGADTLAGGFGGDTYIVHDPGDAVVETSNDPPPAAEGISAVGDIIDTVLAAIEFSLEGVEFVENVTLLGTASSGTGNELSNIITGNGIANTLSGLAGNDTLNGEGGKDTLVGGSGADSMAGGAGNDTYLDYAAGDRVTEALSSGTDLIQSSISVTALAANVEKLKLMGGAGLNGTGNTLANTLTGNAGANRLNGGAGNDTVGAADGNDILAGGKGGDRLTGGAGADKFDFNAALNPATNVDRIVDFNVTADRIRLDNDFFTAFTNVNAALAQGAFYRGAGKTQAHDANDRIIYNTTTGNLYYDADGMGTAASKLFAVLTGAPALTAADFFIVT